ncbi:creatininase family protein [Halobellus inordinatus]|uniref:creatininase family protein n=1 Tax=Halobellus inordinatus TaxID=1126236 RepID=UPI00210CA767|nr:creatininase family protein [Halobellus inordinatus]
MSDEYRYDKLTWPEVNEAVEDEKMVLVPVGATEDHGHHLPLDVDRELVSAICERTARDRDDTLLFPTVDHGYLPHHMDYPGGITIDWETFVKHTIDICVSLAHHGFEKILLINGHGSNDHLLQQVARQVILQYPDVHCGNLSWWQLEEVREAARTHRDAGPQGSAHAGEMETSMYLALHPDDVRTDELADDVSYPESKHFNNLDLAGETREEESTPVAMMEWWSTVSETGTMGDATEASAEKGEAFLDAAVEGLHSVLDEYRDHPIREIDDHHARTVEDHEYDPFRPK